MKEEFLRAVSENENNSHPLFDADAQIAAIENPTVAYLQNEELSSIDYNFEQKADISLSPVHCNSRGDIFAALKEEAMSLEILYEKWLYEDEHCLNTELFDIRGKPGRNGADVLRDLESMKRKKETDEI